MSHDHNETTSTYDHGHCTLINITNGVHIENTNNVLHQTKGSVSE